MRRRGPNIFLRMWSATADFFIRWWREATGPLNRSQHRTLGAALSRRICLWAPVAVIGLVLVGLIGYQFFIIWRAHDLAAKAVVNAEEGNARFARLQVYSASSLRPGDPAVKRAAVLVESRLGNPAAVQAWEELGGADLTSAEIDARAESMARHGNGEQFARAVEALEKQGDTVRVAELRSMRSLRGGDMEQAIAEARAAAASDDAPRLRLQLLQLLATRHGSFLETPARAGTHDLAAAREMTALIDGLLDTPLADEALAFGLEASYFPTKKKSAWAAAAWKHTIASNPALLPAAEFLVTSGAQSATDLYNQMNILFIGAPLPQQAAFARWMLNRGMAEQVLIIASAAEASQDEGVFLARASALASLGQWEKLYQLAGITGAASQSLRIMTKAQAARQLGRGGEQSKLVRTALRGAAENGNVAQAVAVADAQGMRSMADEAVVEMCDDSALADGAFRFARDRFGRRGQFATLEAAYQAARKSAPTAASVADYARYLALLEGKIDTSATSAALQNAPTDPGARFNHALALLQSGRGEEAFAVFEDFDVIVDQLPPGLRAVAAAVLAGAGDPNGEVVARGIEPGLLTPGEFALIAKLRMEP